MSDLEAFKAKLAASREKWLPVGKYKILVRRPPQLKRSELQDKSVGNNSFLIALLLECVKDWRGVTAGDLLPGEGAQELEFSPDLLDSLLEDKDVRTEFIAAFMNFWFERDKAEESSAKN
jgi:hypothetical protein